ncbi:uncharacterized protein LOC110858751 isoform X2 [Folsomia candida]|nr:uncharacterized protein LOC110858751 isoform X2 [Folsomia candida]
MLSTPLYNVTSAPTLIPITPNPPHIHRGGGPSVPVPPQFPHGLEHLPPSIIPIFFPSPPFGNGGNFNHSTPRVFHHGIAHDPVFTSGVANGNGKPCPDLNGRKIPSGMHYVPGPDECTLCVCEDGGPKWCKAVLCSPPTDCKSFRVGSSCCDFICLDDSLGGKGSGGGQKTGGPFNGGPLDLADVVPKIIIVAITTILSMSLLLFLIHRLRQKQIQGRLNSAVARARCGEHDCEDGRSVDFSMDFFDRGPPPPHYMSWWKPPTTSYFPPRGEAPPPYEEAIASTSNSLPSTFTAIYNNNNALVPTGGGGETAGQEGPPPPTAELYRTETQECNGVTIATTSLTTTDGDPTVTTTTSSQNNNQVDPPNGTSISQQQSENAGASTSSATSRLLPFTKTKRFPSVNTRIPPPPSTSCPTRSMIVIGSNFESGMRGGGQRTGSETEHLRRSQQTGGGSTSSHLTSRIGTFLTNMLPLPLGSSSSSSNSSSFGGANHNSSANPTTNSSSILLPLNNYPPPYDYAEEAENPYYLRHPQQSLTLPRHFASQEPSTSTFARSQQHIHPQRFSLQLHPSGGRSDGCGWSSSASSSTLSLSPNSPNEDTLGLGGVSGSCGGSGSGGRMSHRPPSLSSSSSSNGSGTNVTL